MFWTKTKKKRIRTKILTNILPYIQVSGLIEALAHTESRRHPHPGFDFEDMAQEIRMECVRVLSYYDPARIGPSPFKFLQTCVRNKLYNMQRGTLVPNNPPCVRCPLWNKTKKICKINEEGCDLIIKYRRNMATKTAIRQPHSLEIDIIDYKKFLNTNAIILDESIRSKLPKYLIKSYEKMIGGHSREVNSKHKTLIRKIVKKLIKYDG